MNAPCCQQEIILFPYLDDFEYDFVFHCQCDSYVIYKNKDQTKILEALNYIYHDRMYCLINEINGLEKIFKIERQVVDHEFETILEVSSFVEDFSLWTEEYFRYKIKLIEIFS